MNNFKHLAEHSMISIENFGLSNHSQPLLEKGGEACLMYDVDTCGLTVNLSKGGKK